MRIVIAPLLSICLLGLAGNTSNTAQGAEPVLQEKPSAAEQEKLAAEKAAEQEKRDAARAIAREKQAAAREKQAQAREKRVAEREKRIAENQKRAAAHLAAQQKRSVEQALRQARRPEGTFKLLGSRLGFGKVVKGAPYSATAITEHTQTLSDGNQIIQKNEAIYYRDSEGRTRIDQKLKTIGKWTTPGEPPQMITIYDPVAGNFYSLDPRTHTAIMDVRVPRRDSQPNPNPKPKPLEPSGSTSSSREPNDSKQVTAPKIVVSADGNKKKERLTGRVIEGVSVEGTRQTHTIPAGEIGNVAPIVITDENWYSPELQVPVMTSHHDPRSGDTVYRLTNINRSEPARSLFEVPADYRIVDRRVPKLPPNPGQPKIAEPPKNPGQEL